MLSNIPIFIILAAASGIALGIPAGLLLRRKNRTIGRGAVSIGASTVSGRGAFASRSISESEIIERCPAIEVTDGDVGGELLNYVFYGSAENLRLVAMGYGMLFNHSPQPNVAYYRDDSPLGAELVLYALRDIRKGEELFYDYGNDWWTTRG
jgi:uncharacterized protein